MKRELNFYDIYPKVHQVRQTQRITIKAMDERYNFDSHKEYKIICVPIKWHKQHEEGSLKPIKAKVGKRCMVFETTFESEQEYYIRIYEDEQLKAQLSIYALEEDLYNRIPLKGDLHAHSTRSDGNESPALVAANYRKVGADFLALTDHYTYEPSVEVQDVYKGIRMGLNLLRGEEVHSPDNYVHIVHIGGKEGVNKLWKNNREKYFEEVCAIQQTLEVPKEIDSFIYAAVMWVAQKIKEVEGLSILAHPYWIEDTHNVPDVLTYELVKNNVCEALELIGGQTPHENNLQVAFYQDLRCETGKSIPIVGSSDAHWTIRKPNEPQQLFNEFKTIVFGKENNTEELLASIRELYSVAIEEYEGESYKVHGKLRLVMYARFLMEHYYPYYDELCIQEGEAMRRYLLGEDGSKEEIEQLNEKTLKIYKKYFGK